MIPEDFINFRSLVEWLVFEDGLLVEEVLQKGDCIEVLDIIIIIIYDYLYYFYIIIIIYYYCNLSCIIYYYFF